jgi:hypothetical protein
VAVVAIAWALWQPEPRTGRRFDRGANGLWVGHQWLTGRHVHGGTPVDDRERAAFLRSLSRHRIRYVFLHAGPLSDDGSVADRAGPFFARLRAEAKAVQFIPWLGGDTRRLGLGDPAWRAAVVRTVLQLKADGFDGVHLDLEPVLDGEPGYLELLAELRAAAGPAFLISHATRRAGPFGWAAGPMRKWFWSRAFYEAAMASADQTVLMAYDTSINNQKNYIGFVSYETETLLKWACAFPRHRVLIGIPSYEDVPRLSNPKVENIVNASLGVRAALEGDPQRLRCFDGVAVYAEWVTDADEWRDYEQYWLGN